MWVRGVASSSFVNLIILGEISSNPAASDFKDFNAELFLYALLVLKNIEKHGGEFVVLSSHTNR